MRAAQKNGKAQNSEAVRELLIRKRALEAEKEIREQEVQIYLAYGRNLSPNSLQPAELIPFLQTFIDVRKGILDVMSTLDKELHAIDKLIDDEKEKESTSQQASGRVKLYIMVEKDCDVKLKLTYSTLISCYHSTNIDTSVYRIQWFPTPTGSQSTTCTPEWQRTGNLLRVLPCTTALASCSPRVKIGKIRVSP